MSIDQVLRNELTPQQYDAAVDTAREVLCLACAGSGKSRTLAYRIAVMKPPRNGLKTNETLLSRAKAVGIEIEERWCEVAAARLQQAVMLFGGIEPSTERLTGGDQLTADTPQTTTTQSDAKPAETAQ